MAAKSRRKRPPVGGNPSQSHSKQNNDRIASTESALRASVFAAEAKASAMVAETALNSIREFYSSAASGPHAAAGTSSSRWDDAKRVIDAASFLVAVVALIMSLYTWRVTLLKTQESNSAQMVVDLAIKFDDSQYRKRRKEFAGTLLGIMEGKPEIHLNANDDAPVLDFFEDVGYLSKIEILDDRMVWNSFIWPVEHYYLAIARDTDILKNMRGENYETIYREFESLHHRVIAIDRSERQLKPSDEIPTKEQVMEFLKAEIELIE